MKVSVFVLAGVFIFGIHTAAIAEICSIQCTTDQGKKVGSKFRVNSAHPGECKSRGIRAVRSKCDGNGIVTYALCYGNIINNKIMKQKLNNC